MVGKSYLVAKLFRQKYFPGETIPLSRTWDQWVFWTPRTQRLLFSGVLQTTWMGRIVSSLKHFRYLSLSCLCSSGVFLLGGFHTDLIFWPAGINELYCEEAKVPLGVSRKEGQSAQMWLSEVLEAVAYTKDLLAFSGLLSASLLQLGITAWARGTATREWRVMMNALMVPDLSTVAFFRQSG